MDGDPDTRAAPGRLAPHGTRSRYLHRSRTCRCPQCTAANTRYMADYRRRRRELAQSGQQLTLPDELLPRSRSRP